MRPGASRGLFFDCFDDFGDHLTFEITDQPDLGTLTPSGNGTSPFRTYKAGATEGDDSFSYRATSDNGTSNTVIQVVHVDADANSAPSCFTNSGFPELVPAGHARTLDPGCSDADGDTISYTKLSEPTHGTLSDAGGTLVYTPADGYTGPDQFNYKATDGHSGESAPTTHHVQVVTPSAPTCTPSSPVTMRTNSFRSFIFSCSDPFDDALTYVIDSQPAHGTLSGSGQSRTFSAGPDEGDATFTWHAHGPNSGDSATQTQVVTIDADANTAPTCQASSSNAKPGVQRTITPSCGDPEFDSLTYTKQSNPAHGTLTDTDGVLRYTADSGYLGADSFTFRASDGHGGQSGITTISITVTTANTAPSCFAGPYQFEVESGSSLLFSTPPCSDPDGDTLTYEIVDQPTHGTISAPARAAAALTRPPTATRARTRSRSAPPTAPTTRRPTRSPSPSRRRPTARPCARRSRARSHRGPRPRSSSPAATPRATRSRSRRSPGRGTARSARSIRAPTRRSTRPPPASTAPTPLPTGRPTARRPARPRR